MLAIYAALAAALFGSDVLCAPTASLDAKVFLQNSHDAQALNAKFATLRSSDPCVDGEMSCMKDSIAHCTNTTWQLQACPKTLSCFALPSVKEQGTVLSCTSNVTALSLINASGATGGIAANSKDNEIDLPMDCNGDDESDDSDTDNSTVTQSQSSSAHSASHTSKARATSNPTSSTAAATDDSATVTITVTLAPTSTLPSETLTLNRSQASSLLSSLTNDPNVSVTTIVPSPSPSASSSLASLSTSAVSVSTNAAGTAPAIVSPTFLTLHSSASPAASTDGGYYARGY